MHLTRLLLGAALCATTLGQNLAALAQLPSCALQCSSELLAPAGCALTDIRNCLCRNHTLQYDISKCVVDSCSVSEQYKSLTILQTEVCNGVPQPSRSDYVVRTSVILAAVTFTIIILRFISRLVIARRVWWDDWTIGLAAIFMVPMTILPIYPSAHLGLGKHFYSVPPENIVTLLKLFYITQLLYVVIQTLAKMSILLLYLRIFPSPRFRLILTIAMTLMTCHGLAFLFAVAFQCYPVNSIWNRELPGQCLNLRALIYTGAGFSIFEDFAIMFLPVFELKGLNLGRRKRIALAFMFALGSFACVTSIIRLKFVSSYGNTIDETWDYVHVVIWSQIETYTAVICASLMCIRPLIMKWLPGIFPSTSNQSGNGTNRSWGAKIGSKIRKSRNFDGGVELDGEERGVPHGSITVTTESTVSYEMKNARSEAREVEVGDNETMASREPLNKF